MAVAHTQHLHRFNEKTTQPYKTTNQNTPMKTPHKNLFAIAILAAASLLLLQGCATSRPGTIVGDTIVNPTIAFTGYRAHIPPGYAEISTVKTAEAKAPDLVEIEMLKQFDAKKMGGPELDVVDAFKFRNRENRSLVLFIAFEACMPGLNFSTLPDNARNALLNTFQHGSLPDTRGTWRRIPSPGSGSILFSGQAKNGSDTRGVAISITLGKVSEAFIIVGVSANSDSTAIIQDVAAMTAGIALK